MKILKSVWIALFTMIFGMSGGQGKIGGKAPRRFGIGIFSFITAIFHDGFDWKDCTFLLLIPFLIMGYGENSFLMGWLGSEWLVRVVYGLLLSLPFFFFGWRRGAFAGILLAIAFSVHLGSFGNIAGFGDLLGEDAVRYGILGILIAFNIFFPKKK